MAFLAAFAGGGGGLSADVDSSQSAAITTGAFGGGTRGFGNVQLGSGKQNGTGNYMPYVLGAGIILVAYLFLRKR